MADKKRGLNPKSPKDPAESSAKVGEIRGTIGSEANSLEKENEEASKYIEAAQNQIEAEAQAVNNVLEKAQAANSAVIGTLRKESGEVLRAADSVYDSLERYLNLVSIGFLIVFYGVYVAIRGLVYDPELFIGLVFAVIYYGSVRTVLKSLHRQIGTSKTNVGLSVGAASTSASQLAGQSIRFKPKLDSVNSKMDNLVGSVQKILGIFRNYVPALETHYSNLARVNNQETFVRTMANSLREYGFPLEGDAYVYLNNFASFTDTPDEWVQESAKRLSVILGVDEPILKLAYYDFVGDRENAKNWWLMIANEPTSVRKLVQTLIRNGVVESEYLGKDIDRFGPIENLVALNATFDLAQFRETFSRFYIQLVKEKLFLLNALSSHRIQHESIDDAIREFPPTSLEEGQRINQLCEFVGSQLVLPGALVSLIYHERAGNPSNREAAWVRVRDDPKSLQTLASQIIDNGLLEVPDAYRSNHGPTIQYIAGLLATWDDFTLQRARSETARSFAGLALAKDQFVRALESFKIALDTSIREEFGALLIGQAELDTIPKWFARRVLVPPEILSLFHADYLQSAPMRRTAFAMVKDRGLTGKLAEELIHLSVIQAPEGSDESSAVSSLNSILQVEQDFDVVRLRGTLWAFSELLEFGRDILQYSNEQGVVADTGKVNLDYVLEILKQEDAGYYQRHFMVTEYIIKSGSIFGDDSGKTRSVTMALLVLYLDSRGNPLRKQACSEAESDEICTKMLYRYVATKEENEQPGAEGRTNMNEIAIAVFAGDGYKYEDLVHFRRELNNGFLVPKLSFMLETRLISMVQQVDRLGNQKQLLATALQSVGSTVKQVLDTEYREDAVEKSLKMNLISAYMVTSKSREALFGKIIDKYLPQAIEDLASKDDHFRDLLILAPKAAAGKSTRFGLVPFNVNFDQFSHRFILGFRLAVKNYLRDEGYQESEADRYTVNVVRVFPSDNFFKSVVGSSEVGLQYVEHPVSLLRNLVVEHYGAVEKIELVASVRRKEDKGVALKSLIEVIFNSKSTLYQMKRGELSSIIPGSKILDVLENGEFENAILSDYNLSLTELAEVFYQSKTRGQAAVQEVRTALDQTVERAVRRFGGKLTADQKKGVADAIEASLRNIGSIMDSFAAEISQINLSVAN